MAPADDRVERLSPVLAAAACVAYWAATVLFAGRKLMWNDELYTYYIAAMPSLHEVWGALMARGEQTPPLFYILTRAALHLFGVNNISIRLPEMTAFFGMSVCLFFFVRRRTTPLAGLCAALFPLVTMAYGYAFEARSYALLLGFGGASLLAWQRAGVASPRRWLSVLCLTIALAATASSHYYGAFVTMAIAAGELVRTAHRRRVDGAVWAAFAVSLVPLVFQLPLIRAGAAYSGAFWSPPQWVNVPDFYQDLLSPAVVPLMIVLVASTILLVWTDLRDAEAARSDVLPLEEMAAAAALIAIPLVAVATAKLVTGAFVNRYALPAVLGFAVLAGFGTAGAFKRTPALRLLTVASLLAWFGLSQAREFILPTGVTLPVSARSMARPSEWIAALPADIRSLPLVIADPHTFTTLSYYGAPEIKERMVYAADPDKALKYLGTNSVERGMVDLLKPWFHLNVVPFDAFTASHDRFLIYGDFVRLAFLNWMLPAVHDEAMHTELLNREGDDMLLLAWRDGEGRPADQVHTSLQTAAPARTASTR